MRFLADENFNGKLLSGLRQRMPDVDIIYTQDTPMYQSGDPQLLAWAAQEGRIVLTHDVQTLIGFAYDRVKNGLPMPRVIEVENEMPIGAALEQLAVMIGASTSEDFIDQVRYIPF
ncbi:MAG: hypothetical protein OHK0046_20270 [Anaerolineae bacterium]